MTYSSSDADLMIRFQNGDMHCFEELVERHKQRVFNVAYKYMGNVHDAEDVAQQVFINIYNAQKTYTPTAQFTTWLYTVCKNTCLKTFRKKRVQTSSLDEDVPHGNGVVSTAVADPQSHTPLEDALDSERERVVRAAIEALPANQKTVIILYKYEQLSYEEIARVMGVSTQAVKSLLHRARMSLKEQLKDYFNR